MTDIMRNEDYFRVCAYAARGGESVEAIMDAVNIAMRKFSTAPTIAWEACRILELRKERRLNRPLIGDAIPLCESILYISKDMTASHKLINRQF